MYSFIVIDNYKRGYILTVFMADFIFVVVTIALFWIGILYVKFCEKL